MVMASRFEVEVVVDVVLKAWKELKNTRKFSYILYQNPHFVFSWLFLGCTRIVNNSTMGPSFVGRPVLAGNVVPPYQAVAQGGPSSGYAGNGKRDNGYPPQPPPLGLAKERRR
ncbi:hypothetical protein K1719_046852 [Acacia pycnantha]|nr:hypothetical protein K1719_046852 [Acacia pycnantha]